MADVVKVCDRCGGYISTKDGGYGEVSYQHYELLSKEMWGRALGGRKAEVCMTCYQRISYFVTTNSQ